MSDQRLIPSWFPNKFTIDTSNNGRWTSSFKKFSKGKMCQLGKINNKIVAVPYLYLSFHITKLQNTKEELFYIKENICYFYLEQKLFSMPNYSCRTIEHYFAIMIFNYWLSETNVYKKKTLITWKLNKQPMFRICEIM